MEEQFAILVRIAVLVVATLLPLINPAGSAAIFHSMTVGIGDAVRRKMAWQIGLNSFFLVTAATFVGSYVLDFFGVSLTSVRIGGGLLVAASGWKLLNADEKTGTKTVLSADVSLDRRPGDHFRGDHHRRQLEGTRRGPMAARSRQPGGLGRRLLHRLFELPFRGPPDRISGRDGNRGDAAPFGVHFDVRGRADCDKRGDRRGSKYPVMRQ
jgi:hypothetical protein